MLSVGDRASNDKRLWGRQTRMLGGNENLRHQDHHPAPRTPAPPRGTAACYNPHAGGSGCPQNDNRATRRQPIHELQRAVVLEFSTDAEDDPLDSRTVKEHQTEAPSESGDDDGGRRRVRADCVADGRRRWLCNRGSRGQPTRRRVVFVAFDDRPRFGQPKQAVLHQRSSYIRGHFGQLAAHQGRPAARRRF